MKFIHTADLHLGNSMHEIDRSKESEVFLCWLRKQIMDLEVQALIIAGDIFDVVNPSNIAKSQYYRFLASLQGTSCTNVVVVGGNHDSGALLDAPAEILEFLNVKVVGSICNRTIEDLVFELKDDKGEIIGICCAVPFMRDLELVDFYKRKNSVYEGENPIKEGVSNISDKDFSDDNLLKRLYEDVYTKAEELRAGRDIPLLATGHLYAADLEGRNLSNFAIDNGVRDVVGTIGNVSIDIFPKGFNYVALGHIHYSTRVAKNEKVRYSGSPFVMGFDEAKHAQNILVVDVRHENLPSVHKINVPRTVIRYEQFEGDLDTLKQKLRYLEHDLKQNPQETYVDVILTSGNIVNLNAELEAEEKDKLFVVKRHRIAREIFQNYDGLKKNFAKTTKEFTPRDYFKMLIASKVGKDADSDEVKNLYADYLDMFDEAVALATDTPDETN